MKEQIGLKSLYRRPIHTFLLFLMFVLAAFLIFSKLIEYEGIRKNIQTVSQYYKAVGTLENIDPSQYDISRGISIIENDTDIALLDIRKIKSGVVEGMYNADIDAYSESTNYCYFYGIVSTKYTNKKADDSIKYTCNIKVEKVVAAMPEHLKEGDIITCPIDEIDGYSAEETYEGLKEGEEYLLKARIEHHPSGIYLFSIIPFEQGERYIHLTENKPLDLLMPEFEALNQEIELLQYNLYALDLRSTYDMENMPRMQTVYYLKEGRLITLEDNKNRNQVCVVRRELADLRGLKVGDTITITMRDLEMPLFGTVMELEKDTWRKAETKTKDFEIIGIFGSTDKLEYITMFNSTIYIPTTCLPDNWESWLEASTVSFYLSSPEKEDEFKARYEKILEEMGLKISFYENNWEKYYSLIKPLEESAQINIKIFLAISLVLFLLFLTLYFQIMKREYKIMRILGTTQKRAIFQIQMPLWIMILTGYILAILGAFWYGKGKVEKVLQGAETLQYPIKIEISKILLYGLFIFSVIICFIYLYSRRMTRESIVEKLLKNNNKLLKNNNKLLKNNNKLLKNNNKKTIKKSFLEQKEALVKEEKSEQKEAIFKRQISETGSKKKKRIFTVFLYIIKRIKRTFFKSSLIIISSAMFLIILGWIPFHINNTQKEITNIYQNIDIKGQIVMGQKGYQLYDHGFISAKVIEGIRNIEEIDTLYLEIGDTVNVSVTKYDEKEIEEKQSMKQVIFMAADNPEELLKFNQNAEIEYRSGYNYKTFNSEYSNNNWRYAIVKNTIMEQLQVELGDVIEVRKSSGIISYRIIGVLKGAVDYVDIIVPLKSVGLLYEYGDSERYAKAEFIFRVSDIDTLENIRNKLKEIINWQSQDLPKIDFVLQDREVLQAVKPLENNIHMMQMLYPIVWIVAIIFNVVVSWFSILLSQKEMAIMRILGTSKKKVIQLIGGTQIVNSLLGIGLGIIFLVFILYHSFSKIILIAAGTCGLICILSTCISGYTVLKKKPLSLVQTKE